MPFRQQERRHLFGQRWNSAGCSWCVSTIISGGVCAISKKKKKRIVLRCYRKPYLTQFIIRRTFITELLKNGMEYSTWRWALCHCKGSSAGWMTSCPGCSNDTHVRSLPAGWKLDLPVFKHTLSLTSTNLQAIWEENMSTRKTKNNITLRECAIRTVRV